MADESGQEQTEEKPTFRDRMKRFAPNVLRGAFSSTDLETASENAPSFDAGMPRRWAEES